MPHISFRVTDNEKEWIEEYAKLHGLSSSEAVKAAFFEKLDDEYDLRTIREHENDKVKGVPRYYSLDEAKKELGLGDEL